MANATNTTTPTTVIITEANGTTFSTDLKDLSAANATKLYAALGHTGTKTNYQQLADQVAGFAHNFKSIVTLQSPMGTDYQQLIKNYCNALKEGGGQLQANCEDDLKQFQATALGQSIMQSGMYKTAEGTAAAVGAVGEFFHGVTAPFRVAGAAISGAVGAAGDGYDQLSFGMSEQQAKAIGTAYAAALYSQVDAPSVRHEANTTDEIFAEVESFANGIWHSLPPGLTAYLFAVVNYLENGFHWDAAYSAGVIEADKVRATPALNYEQTLQRDLVNHADKASRPDAAQMLREAGTIAGMATAPVANIVDKGGVSRDTKGTYQTVEFKDGAPTTAVVKNDQGKPVTQNQRNEDRVQKVADEVPQTGAEWVGAGAAALGVGYLETTRFAPIRGAVNLGTGLVAGTVKRSADVLLGTAAGISQGTASVVNIPVKVVGKLLPSSLSPEEHLAATTKATDDAGAAAAKAATKAGKQAGLSGDELIEHVRAQEKSARLAALQEAMEPVKPSNIFVKAGDWVASVGDWVHNVGATASTKIEGWSAAFTSSVDSVKSAVTFDRATAAQKAKRAADAQATLAAEAAKGNLSEEALSTMKTAQAETFGGKASAAFGSLRTKLPTWLGGTEAEAKVAEEATQTIIKIAPKATRFFGIVRGVTKFATAVPLLGAVVVGGEMLFSEGAHAETVDGVTLNFREQLTKDYIVGRISESKYNFYKNAQDHAFLTGLGGIMSAGVVEVAQDSVSELDKASMARYLPPSILDSAREWGGHEIPDIAPQSAAELLTVKERLARIDNVKKEAAEELKNLGHPSLLPSVPTLKLGTSIDMTKVLQSVAMVPAAPEKTVVTPEKPVAVSGPSASLTHEEILAALPGVKQQVQMSVNRAIAPTKLAAFNLGTEVTTTMGSVLPNGLPSATASTPAKQSGQAYANA